MKNVEWVERKIGNWNAIVFLDEELFHIMYNGNGGAIISNKSLKIAEELFLNAMELFEYVKKNMHHKK